MTHTRSWVQMAASLLAESMRNWWVYLWRGMLKSKKKKEKIFKISFIEMPLGVDQRHIEVKPFTPSRISPLADDLSPSRKMTSARGSDGRGRVHGSAACVC